MLLNTRQAKLRGGVVGLMGCDWRPIRTMAVEGFKLLYEIGNVDGEASMMERSVVGLVVLT
jgi:hypothetical protein